MFSRNAPFRLAALLLLVALMLSPATRAAPPADTPSPLAVFAQMQQQAAGSLFVHWDEATGIPLFLRGAIPFVAPGGKTTATERAIAFFGRYRDLYRMANPALELTPVQVKTDALGMTHARLQQQVGSVPVWGAQMVVHFDAAGHVRAVNGTYLPGTVVNTTPSVKFPDAVTTARANLLTDERATLYPDRSGLVVYRRGGPVALAWKVQLWTDEPLGNWIVFVDAHDGSVIHRLNSLDTARNRRTFDANHTSSLPGTLVCDEGNPTCTGGDPVEKAAHRNAGITYDYYFSKFGRDSYDDAGAALISSVHYNNNYNNAFWNGTQMVYGDGDGVQFSYFSGGLDVVAHELTHAVTNLTTDLIYEDEPGALNESYSDVFGTFTEFFSEPAQADWLLGEDIYTPGVPGDALRNMADPTLGTFDATDPRNSGGQPDHMSSYVHYPLVIDSGGVHTNSGIPNKAAYLIAQGGTFSGVPVAGIGITKTEQIYYRTLVHYLTPPSDFWAAREASIQSCQDLIGSFGIAPGNCDSVQDGFAAVGIGPGTALSHVLFLPVIQRNYALGQPPGIYGRVTDAGKPATGVPLALRKCSGSSCATQAATTTDSNGLYRFVGVPSLAGGQWYYVRYLNPDLVGAGTSARPDEAGANVRETLVQATLDNASLARTPQIDSPAGASGTVTLVNETFEGAFPDCCTTVNGHWDKSSCRAFEGSFSGWIEGATALACSSNYHTSEESSMIFGPFDLSDATAASMTYKTWINSEVPNDRLCHMASTDGAQFFGSCLSGNSVGWMDRALDLSNVPPLGNLVGQPNVWVALYWSSDSSTTLPEGAYVDNVTVQKTTAGGPTSTPTAIATATQAPTRTPTATPSATLTVELYAAGKRVSAWYADNISPYLTGTNRRGGDFDIADIPLTGPADGSAQSFPITFDWLRRPASFPDLYQVELLDAAGKIKGLGNTTDYLGSEDTLNSLPAGTNLGVPYFWNVIAYGPDGYGLSHDTYEITFTVLANGELGVTTVTRVPTSQVQDLEELRPRDRYY